MATWARVLVVGLVILGVAQPAAATFVDAVLAETGEAAITASEIGLARALGLYDLHAAAGPIEPAEVERFADGRLLEREAVRLEIQPKPAELEAAWRGVADRHGGEASLMAWLARIAVSQDWVRRLVEGDLRRRQFIDFRFRAFALVPPGELEAALGPGPHSDAEREVVEGRLREEIVDRALRDWLTEARGSAGVRLVPGALPVPTPIPLP